MKKRAIIVVDLQNEYLPDGRLPLVGIEAATSNAARVIEAARARGDAVVHIRHENPGRDAHFFVPGTSGVAIIPQVSPVPGEPVIVKHYPNSFRETELEELLDTDNVDELVVIGAMSHMCVEATARAGADLGYGVTVVEDACATMNLEYGNVAVPAAQVHASHMATLAFAYAQVVSTGEFLSRSAS